MGRLKYFINWLKYQFKKPLIGYIQSGTYIGEMWIEIERNSKDVSFLVPSKGLIRSVNIDVIKNGITHGMFDVDTVGMPFNVYRVCIAEYNYIKNRG